MTKRRSGILAGPDRLLQMALVTAAIFGAVAYARQISTRISD
jgi:hypothetical protein